MSVSSQPRRWTETVDETAVPPGGLLTWKNATAQLVIGRAADGAWFALDNRCPHEGYPLAQGDLKETVLTCCWHNWKFDVRNGSCLLGGEDVRCYPVRVVGGRMQVDLTPAPPEQEQQRLRGSLAAALSDADLARAVRDSLRLLQAGTAVERILGDVALHDSLHAEYGATHVLPLAAETRHLLLGVPPQAMARVLAPLLELAAETNRRLPRRPVPKPEAAAGHKTSLSFVRQAVENEQLEAAEAALRAASDAGAGRQAIEDCLFDICSDHFLSFGHSLIYLVKAGELLDVLPDDDAQTIHASLLVNMTRSRREDTLPYLRNYFVPVREWEAQFADRWDSARRGTRTDLPNDVQEAVLSGKRPAAMQAVWDALGAGWTPRQVAQALVLAASQRLLRFDLRLDADVRVQEDWLYATHRLTFASAVRNAIERHDSPQALHFLFQAAAFIHSGARMDDANTARPRPDPHRSLAEIREAILRRDAAGALAGVAAALQSDDTSEELLHMLRQVSIDVHLVRPIFQVHAIKTMLAGIEETRALGNDPQRALPVLAAVRFLASPVHERRAAAAAHAAVEWVEHGRMIRKLTQ
jgi:nitrite reductase/ring-hydroxylating ferredoxin subunit